MTVTANELTEKLLTLDQASELLSSTEPLSSVVFDTENKGEGVPHFDLESGWAHKLDEKAGTDVVGASFEVDGTGWPLTKDALLEATTNIGLTKAYVSRTPAVYIQDQLNYWYAHKPGNAQMLIHGGNGVAFTKGSLKYFSNLELLEKATTAMGNKYGESLLVDYKIEHSLRRTAFRVIAPDAVKTISSARDGGSEDTWSVGLQVLNSLAGEQPLQIDGYLFAWFCTNGQSSVHATSGRYNRRAGQDDIAMEWATLNMEAILMDLENELTAVEDLTSVTLEGELAAVMQDVFRQFKVPKDAREPIIDAMVESDDITGYGLLNSVTQAANLEGLSDKLVTTLFEIGGTLPGVLTKRCTSCHRIKLPSGSTVATPDH